ncbi:MAG TPA: undecaprenyldiphospho-muramoylpentapeptide beta-N-acetylglucosaminyltransferase [Lachnospiraceae bacterium]|jgi:UDP-N-acetylglucosamine--N-acetylmuramyl-(pentapeptide) pyrophosphoryl-undecaprenol N-acetylglucosamine transferase|nr:undecaprenyldiphospho-muramoylpentapeptide beta-N-acetylglucosaminyltransferase [Lachnospiraceae bacterium]
MGKKIVLTGGGTAGHVTANLALIPHLQEEGYEITYIGSISGIERKLIEDYHIPYVPIETGKFRRYFDPKNFSDPFRVLKGKAQAKKFLKEYQPNIVFSKGGYVSVPVVQAAASLKIPVICHESDLTPGLANKLCVPHAVKVCCNFPETVNDLPSDKAVLTGTPIREELFQGDRKKGLAFCGFDESRPVLMIIGGSLGAQSVNQTVRDNLDALLKSFQICHICGKGKMDNLKLTIPGYRQFEYVKDELKDLYAMADVVISRAGANVICELLALKKPNLLVPLPTGRGDQKLNAASFERMGYSMVVQDDDLPDCIVEKVTELYNNRETYIKAMEKSSQVNSISIIMELIDKYARK